METASSARRRMRRYRDKLRASGLRPVQIWAPDTRSPSFAAEVRRQSLAVGGRDEAELMDGLERSLAETEDWTA